MDVPMMETLGIIRIDNSGHYTFAEKDIVLVIQATD